MLPSSHQKPEGITTSPTINTSTNPIRNINVTSSSSSGLSALSVSELRAGIQQFLRSSGALSSLKTQLRSVIVSELLKRQGNLPKNTRIEKVREDGIVCEDEEEDETWTQNLTDALVESHLRHTGRSFSLAIFSSEADVSFSTAGDDALAGMLHLNNNLIGEKGVKTISKSKISLLQRIIELHLRQIGDARGKPPGYAVGTQTDNSDNASSSSVPPPLELRLAAVDAKYALCFARSGQSTREEVDRRMASYREDLQLQMEQAYQQRQRVFEQQKLHEVRRELEEHYKMLLQHKVEEMREVGRVTVARVEAERARLAQAYGDLEVQRVELQRRGREMQQLLEERDKAAAASDGALREARQRAGVLAAQLRQWEELCGVRLAEADAARAREWRRVEDLRRLQAEHLAELQLKDEEISRLRFRLKSILGTNEGVEMRPTSTTHNAFMRGNDMQQRVSDSLQYSSSTQQQQQQEQQQKPPIPREAAWNSAWLSTLSPQSAPLTTSVNTSIPVVTTSERRVDSSSPPVNSEQMINIVNYPQELHLASQKDQQDYYHNNNNDNKKNKDNRVRSSDVLPPFVSHIIPFIDNNANKVANSVQKLSSSEISSSHLLKPNQSDSVEVIEEKKSDDSKNDKQEKFSQKENSSASHSSSSTTTSRTHSQENSKLPVIPNSKDDESRKSQSSLSTTPEKSSTSSHSSKKSQEIKTSTKDTNSKILVTSEQLNLFYQEETNKRSTIEADEDTGRRGIIWAANSQRTVLLQRQAAEKKESAIEEGRPISSIDAYMNSARERQLASQTAADVMLLNESDDDDDSDGILFGNRGSSEESF